MRRFRFPHFLYGIFVRLIATVVMVISLTQCQFLMNDLGTEEGLPSESGGGSGSGGSGGDDAEEPVIPKRNADGTLTSRGYFEDNVVPALQATNRGKTCTQCHTSPRFGGEPGSLSIYSYPKMKKLIDGATPDLNLFMRYTRGQVAGHAGGRDFCDGDTSNTPCFEISVWWAIANKDSGGGGPLGQLNAFASNGEVFGWAVDSSDTDDQIDVEAYIDGPKGTGTLVGTFAANLPSQNLPFAGNHNFRFRIPQAYRDGAQRTLFLYAVSSDGEQSGKITGGHNLSYVRYSPSQAGIDAYNQIGGFGACAACHGNTYEDYAEIVFYDKLINPVPTTPGAQFNNVLMKALRGEDDHGGGTFCNNDTEPCASVIRLWATEFLQ